MDLTVLFLGVPWHNDITCFIEVGRTRKNHCTATGFVKYSRKQATYLEAGTEFFTISTVSSWLHRLFCSFLPHHVADVPRKIQSCGHQLSFPTSTPVDKRMPEGHLHLTMETFQFAVRGLHHGTNTQEISQLERRLEFLPHTSSTRYVRRSHKADGTGTTETWFWISKHKPSVWGGSSERLIKFNEHWTDKVYVDVLAKCSLSEISTEIFWFSFSLKELVGACIVQPAARRRKDRMQWNYKVWKRNTISFRSCTESFWRWGGWGKGGGGGVDEGGGVGRGRRRGCVSCHTRRKMQFKFHT